MPTTRQRCEGVTRFTVGQFMASLAMLVVALPFALYVFTDTFREGKDGGAAIHPVVAVSLWLCSGAMIGAAILLPFGGAKYPLIGATIGLGIQVVSLILLRLLVMYLRLGLGGI